MLSLWIRKFISHSALCTKSRWPGTHLNCTWSTGTSTTTRCRRRSPTRTGWLFSDSSSRLWTMKMYSTTISSNGSQILLSQRQISNDLWLCRESVLFLYTSNLNWELFCPSCQTPSLIPSIQKATVGMVSDDMRKCWHAFIPMIKFFPAPSKRGDGTPDQDCGRISHRTQLKSQSWGFGMDRTWYINIPKNNDWIEWSIFLYYHNQSVFPLVAGWQRSRCECDELFAGEKLCFLISSPFQPF